ncbi:MAG: RnfABCDGE type electron transport complex subunit G [Caldisericia bacterium]|jgi:electron transport complex protein RnfG|nr:RnfABCDGE type electron transport complex subunit G [Caldisericia bacterium]
MNKIIKSGITVFIIATIGAILLSWVYSFTSPKIEEQKIQTVKNAITEIFPNILNFEIVSGFSNKDISGGIKIIEVYKVNLKDGKVGFIIRAKFSGYGGKIESLIGYEEEKCKGIYVLEHSETPGLGSKIVEPSFRNQFVNKNLSDPFKVKSDITPISGATISSNAVSTAIKKIGNFYLENIKKGGS